MDNQHIAYHRRVKLPRAALALAIAFAAVEFGCGEAPAAQTGDMMGGVSSLFAPKPAKAEPANSPASPVATRTSARSSADAHAAPTVRSAPAPARDVPAAPSREQPRAPLHHEHHLALPWSTGHDLAF